MTEAATRKKKILYVGGLDLKVDEAMLHAAFIPFGEIRDVQIPVDHLTRKTCEPSSQLCSLLTFIVGAVVK